MHANNAPTACENCATPLLGAYCHACGQSVVNPIRHTAHAIEEVFESFWHLDGRVFRTLRELLQPGRVALQYLAGHRARYIAPLRLFVVLTVLTFFVGRLVVVDPEPGQKAQPTVQTDTRTIARATTVADVQRELQVTLADLAEARTETSKVPFLDLALDKAERDARVAAAARIRELGGSEADAAAAGAATPDAAPAASAAREDGNLNLSEDGMGPIVQQVSPTRLRDPSKPWHEHDNPVDIGRLPPFADRWFNHKLATAERNARRLGDDRAALWSGVMSQVPTALFVLVPVFALLLKVFYIGSRRLYLEHLVVALYSHAFLLVALLGVFVLSGVLTVAGDGALEMFAGWGIAGLVAYTAAYLLVMQKRVYGQTWLATVVKYVLLGGAYLVLVLLVLVFAVFAVFFGG